MRLWATILVLGFNGLAYAGNSALSQTSAVPAGERVANYLQAVMSTAGELVTAQSPGDMFSPKEPFHFAFDYDPERQVIDVYIIGKLENADDVKGILESAQKLVFRLNDKLQKNFSVTLKPEDLSMDYLNNKSGKVIVKFVNGEYIDKTKGVVESAPTAVSTRTN
jgi:hypothetical protein